MGTQNALIGLKKPCPHVIRFMDHLMGKKKMNIPPLMEFLVDDKVIKQVTEDVLGRKWVCPGNERESQTLYLENVIAFWRELGYDYVRMEAALPFPGKSINTQNTAGANSGTRSWVDETNGAITSWQDFEKYPFPDVTQFDFFALEYLNSHIPEGMGLIVSHGGGIFERTSWIFSMEKLCYCLLDSPDLVETVANKVGSLQFEFYQQILDLDKVVAVFPGDDMGFKTATLISPRDLRRYFLPWHKKNAEIVHARGIPYFLHSCGNILKIMGDLIEDVKIDGKHSFEDAIIPVQQFQKLYKEQIAIIGGMDMHFLSTASPDEVQRKTQELIETCGQYGRYAIGSGNSIADYVPVENYLAMVREVNNQKNK
jgi:uroporphyrinogen decarboxylase